MILTVTLNPLLQKKLYFNSFNEGRANRAESEIFQAGGKGINVSRQLKYLKMGNAALTFLGGPNGKILRKIIADEGIQLNTINVKSNSRWSAEIYSNGKYHSSAFSPNSEISIKEADEFKAKLKKMIPNFSAVVFSGSSPCKNTDDIFAFGVEFCRKHDKICLVDSYGESLKLALPKKPMIVHANISEIEEGCDVKLSTPLQKNIFINESYINGIKMFFLTDGPNEIFASKFGFVNKITPPVINQLDQTGSGDAFVAGLITGIENGIPFEQFSKNATAIGAANAASLETCKVSIEDYSKIIDEVKFEAVGNKMKLIDDSPNY